MYCSLLKILLKYNHFQNGAQSWAIALCVFMSGPQSHVQPQSKKHNIMCTMEAPQFLATTIRAGLLLKLLTPQTVSDYPIIVSVYSLCLLIHIGMSHLTRYMHSVPLCVWKFRVLIFSVAARNLGCFQLRMTWLQLFLHTSLGGHMGIVLLSRGMGSV